MAAENSVFSRKFFSRRTTKAGLWALLVAALGVLGLWTLSREETLIYAAKALSQRLDGRLQAVDLQGSLLGTIRAGEIHYQDHFGKLSISDARLAWRPIRLLIGQVAVGAVSADTVTLE